MLQTTPLKLVSFTLMKTRHTMKSLKLSGLSILSESTLIVCSLQDLSKIEPTINGPFTPDLATPLSRFGSFVKSQGWKDEVSATLIGSCTNSSYEDMVKKLTSAL